MARVLLVEDDEDLRDLLGYMLKKAGHELLFAEDGKRAMAQASLKPDIIVLDYMLPEMDGMSVALWLRSDKSTAEIPIIMLTARPDAREQCQALPNVRGFMSKPLDPKALAAEVAAILGKGPA